MKPFIHGTFHFWHGQDGYLLSDESTKRLQTFASADDCVNWLYVNGHKDTARALNRHLKSA